MEELAIRVENVSKEYRLGAIGGATLKGEIQSKLAKIFHKEDPNLKIGEKSHNKNERFLALNDLSFDIKKGETVGIIGGTGSSKSTLVQLISRLYDVTEGRVLVGGVDVRDYDMTVLRNEVAVVLQKNVLFSGTIKENLRWGDENATDEEIERVCKLAQADEFIRSFPDGYDHYIEQGGTNVSGGQKQRLCIARALLKKPKILILDDSTSAVDTATDAKIREAFAGVEAVHAEARALMEADADGVMRYIEGLQALWDKALVDAARNVQGAQKAQEGAKGSHDIVRYAVKVFTDIHLEHIFAILIMFSDISFNDLFRFVSASVRDAAI